jgi:signal transduction histidine kinase/ActR/RegA family two-component response regulator
MMLNPRILIIDDEKVICDLFVRVLGERGYDVDVAQDGVLALEKIKAVFYNLVITDFKMPKVNGLEVLREIKRINPYIEVIIMTGYATIESAVEAIKIGAFDFVCKPFDIEELAKTIKRCIDKQKLTINAVELNELGTLFEVSKVITAKTSLDALLRLILNSAVGMTRATSGYIALFNSAVDEIVMKIVHGMDENALTLSQARHDAQMQSAASPQEGSAISIVLKRAVGDIMGVMCIRDKESEAPFSERERTLLSVLAAQAVSALENYHLYSQLQEKLQTLEQTIQQLHATQDQLIQTEKMAAVGQLAFGIAHEIRNPLGIILGGVDFVGNRMGAKDEIIDESILKIKNAIERANAIILSLLKFSRTSKLDSQSISLQWLIEEVVSLVANQACMQKVRIEKDVPQEQILIQADPTMLRQALFNLCVNAFDAMPAGGCLSIQAKSSTAPGDVCIEVSDTGTGMPESVARRIFDPFFTTKETGKGTGLGLTIVHLIIQRHQGSIRVDSEPDKGTRFTITLPRAATPARPLEPALKQEG